MAKPKILVVEDERSLVEVLACNLEREGFEVLVARDGQDGLLQAQIKLPDLVVLDLMLPVKGGLDVCRELRMGARTRDIPIVMVTAKAEETDQLVGFATGADDYVTKPYSIKVLVQRIKKELRRRQQADEPSSGSVHESQGIVVDRHRHRASFDGAELPLTPTEFRLLETMLRQAGRAFTRAATGGGGSVADLVGSLGLDPGVADAVLARVEISCAQGGERLDPSVLEHVAAFDPLPSHRIAGGNQGLALAMADRLGERIRLRAPARAIDDGVVRTDAGDLPAEHVIVTLPLPLTRALPITPGLPGWKRDALDRIEFGHAAKLHVPLAAPPPTSAVMSVPDRYWCWTATERDAAVAPVLNCFAGSPRALDGLGVEAGADAWLDRVIALRPDLDLDRAGAVLTTWSDDEWTRGAYRADGLHEQPGDDEALARPVGTLHFAGEHTAGPLSGLMEGALRSGLRAAAEIPG